MIKLPAKDRFNSTFKDWPVPGEWKDELYRYVILGLPPGSFHTAVYANDLTAAACRSHPSNTWNAIIGMCKWILHVAPPECHGSYEKVEAWLALSKDERRVICEKRGVIATEQEIMWETLTDTGQKKNVEQEYPF